MGVILFLLLYNENSGREFYIIKSYSFYSIQFFTLGSGVEEIWEGGKVRKRWDSSTAFDNFWNIENWMGHLKNKIVKK